MIVCVAFCECVCSVECMCCMSNRDTRFEWVWIMWCTLIGRMEFPHWYGNWIMQTNVSLFIRLYKYNIPVSLCVSSIHFVFIFCFVLIHSLSHSFYPSILLSLYSLCCDVCFVSLQSALYLDKKKIHEKPFNLDFTTIFRFSLCFLYSVCLSLCVCMCVCVFVRTCLFLMYEILYVSCDVSFGLFPVIRPYTSHTSYASNSSSFNDFEKCMRN